MDGRRHNRLLDILDIGANIVDAVDARARNFADADQVVDLLVDLRDALANSLLNGRDGLSAARQELSWAFNSSPAA